MRQLCLVVVGIGIFVFFGCGDGESQGTSGERQGASGDSRAAEEAVEVSERFLDAAADSDSAAACATYTTARREDFAAYAPFEECENGAFAGDWDELAVATRTHCTTSAEDDDHVLVAYEFPRADTPSNEIAIETIREGGRLLIAAIVKGASECDSPTEAPGGVGAPAAALDEEPDCAGTGGVGMNGGDIVELSTAGVGCVVATEVAERFYEYTLDSGATIAVNEWECTLESALDGRATCTSADAGFTFRTD